MSESEKPNHYTLYKSIVICMMICIPVGVWLGLIKGSITLGLLSGNSVGLALGITYYTLLQRYE
jgi:hypothetical protein